MTDFIQTIVDLLPIKGYLSYLSGIGLFLIGAAGTLMQLATLVGLVGQCLAGQVDITTCLTQVPQLAQPLLIALAGSAVVGLRRAMPSQTAPQA